MLSRGLLSEARIALPTEIEKQGSLLRVNLEGVRLRTPQGDFGIASPCGGQSSRVAVVRLMDRRGPERARACAS
jgi:hypothetical protein